MSSAKIEDESGEAELPWFEGNFAQALDHAEKHFQFIFAVLETDANPFKRELLATSQLLDLLGKGKLILWGSVANTAEVRKVATEFGCMELPIAILITPVSLPGVNSNVLATFPENSIAQVFTETLSGSINVNTPRINRIRDDHAAQAATQDDEEFRIISTLCHVLDNPSLFNHTSESRRLFQIPLKVNINAQPYMGKSTRAHLKTLRQLCFLLVRNHEIIAAVPHVLPGGVVGVLSGTTTSGEILGDKSALLHLTHNGNDVYVCRKPISSRFVNFVKKHRSGSNRFCMQTIPSTQPPEKIMKHILSSWYETLLVAG